MEFINTGKAESFDIVHLPFELGDAMVEYLPLDTMKFTYDGNTYIVTSAELITYGKLSTNQNPKSFNTLKNELTSFFGQGGPIAIPNTYDLPDGMASVTFNENFLVTPLVFMMPNEIGSNAGYIRFKDVSVSGFNAVVVEPPNYDGQHAGMTVPYFSFLPGKYNLGAITIEVGFVDTTKVQGSYAVAGNDMGWDRVTLSQDYSNLSVITSIQTMNNEENPVPTEVSQPWITPTVRVIDNKTFDICLDRSQTSAGIITETERVAYIAFSTNQQSSFTDHNSNNVFVETKYTNNVKGWDDGGTDIAYNGSYSTVPLVLASINSRKSSEGGWLRFDSSLTTTSAVNLKIDHDSEQNVERNHTAEDAGLLIISRDFILKNT